MTDQPTHFPEATAPIRVINPVAFDQLQLRWDQSMDLLSAVDRAIARAFGADDLWEAVRTVDQANEVLRTVLRILGTVELWEPKTEATS